MERRLAAILLADVVGFSAQVNADESGTHRRLSALRDEFITPLVTAHRGRVVKTMGDGFLCEFSSVATALEMQRIAGQLNRDFVARGWPPLKIGIGLNTGEMRVGDMGSRIRRAYTVMGDAVNLSSRLEGITKVYGVGVAVGEGTRAAAPEFVYRELDRVRVKGKTEPVPIFEPLGTESELSDGTRSRLQRWHEALALVRAQEWDRAEQILDELQAANPGDMLYALYLERIAYYRAHPPGDEWDGVTIFETK